MIEENVKKILSELPEGVRLVAAAKGRTAEEAMEAVWAGAKILGENYVQEAEEKHSVIGDGAKWHMIGHLQSNKAKKAAEIFDMVETVGSADLARALDRRCADLDKTMPVLIEINSGREENKSGVFPEKAIALIREIAGLRNIRVSGLMTMGPFVNDSEDLRPYFKETRMLFERIGDMHIPSVEMIWLSMGMSDSYKIAIEEKANIVRIGAGIFGPRNNK